MYSKAIELDPTESIYFANRAKTYKKLNKFGKVTLFLI